MLIHLVLSAVLAGCAQAPATTTFDLALPTPIPTPVPAARVAPHPSLVAVDAVSTLAALPLPSTPAVSTRTLGLTGTPRPEARLRIECREVLPSQLVSLAASGLLVLADASNNTFILDLSTGDQKLANQPNEMRVSFAASPSRQRLAYRRIIRDDMRIQTLENSLVIATADGTPLQVLPWEAGWSAVTGWLDEGRLVINLVGVDPTESTARKAATLTILDLTSGHKRVLRAEYPQIYAEYPVPDWDQWGVTVYDPSLTRVVYAYDSLERFDAGFRLWNVGEQRTLASVPASSLTSTPRWSPDGSQFVVAANTGADAGWMSFELYTAGRDGGEVQRRTFLTEHYTKVFIQSYAWSPDGRWIAFWLVADPEGVPFIEHGEAHLALLDTSTGQVTNTCLPGEHDASAAPAFAPPPLWSPDSTQLVVENTAANGQSRVLLLDLASGLATAVAESVRPEAWLMAP